MGRLSQGIERGHAAGQPHGRRQVAARLGRGRGRAETVGETVAQLIAAFEHPVVVEAGQQLRRAALERRLRLAGRQQPLDLTDVGPGIG
jgi:hypothetical protein